MNLPEEPPPDDVPSIPVLLPSGEWDSPEKRAALRVRRFHPESKPQMNVLQAIGWILGMFLFAGTISGVAGIALSLVPPFSESVSLRSGIWSLSIVVYGLVLMRVLHGRSARRVLALHWPRVPQMVLVLMLVYPLAVICCEAAFLVENELGRVARTEPATVPNVEASSKTTRDPSYWEIMDETYDADTKLPLVLALLLSLLPPIGEELLLRGIIGRGLVARYGALPGVVFTSILFALIHIDPVRMAGVFLFGVTAHIVYLATRSLYASMLLHFAYLAYCIASWRAANYARLDLAFSDVAGHVPTSLLAASTFVIAAIFFALFRLRPQWVEPDGSRWSPGFVSAEGPRAGLVAPAPVPRFGARLLTVLIFAVTAMTIVTVTHLQTAREKQHATQAILHGNEFYGRGDYAAAAQAYTEAIRLAPNEAMGYSNRGLARSISNDFAASLPVFDQAVNLDPKLADAYAYRALARAAVGRIDEALADYDAYSRLKPDGEMRRSEGAKYFRERARSAIDTKELAAAERYLNVSLRIVASDSEAWTLRGCAHHLQDHWDLAISDYTEALRLQPRDGYAWGYRGYCHLKRCEYAAAIADLSAALQLEPARAKYRLWRGQAYHFQGEYNRALVDYDAAIRLDPNDAKALNCRGRIYYGTGDYDQAVRDYSEALRASPRWAQSYFDRGQAHLEREDFEKAIADLSDAIRINPDLAEAHFLLAHALVTCSEEQWRDARRAIGHAVKANELTGNKFPQYLETLAAAYAAADDFAKAVKWQLKAIEVGYGDEQMQADAKERLEYYQSRGK